MFPRLSKATLRAVREVARISSKAYSQHHESINAKMKLKISRAKAYSQQNKISRAKEDLLTTFSPPHPVHGPLAFSTWLIEIT